MASKSKTAQSVKTTTTDSSVDSHGHARVVDLQNYVVNRMEQFKKSPAVIKKLTQLAAFIPDFILREDSARKIPYQRSTDAVVVMVDISGFTALTEAYSLKGKGGTDQLTKTLTNYLGPLAQCILQANGDIVKYAGDAMLSIWPTSQKDFSVDVQRVIDCSLYIQEKYGSYLCKDVDITIKVKIGVGAGMTHLCWIGHENFQHYVAFGPGVMAASDAEKHCSSGEVILHPSAWQYCNPNQYKIKLKMENYREITKIIAFINPDRRGRPTGHEKEPGTRRSLGSDDVRPHLSEYAETKSEEIMRKFVILPVLRKLDDETPLEYLNESRMICICFIHIATSPMNQEGLAFRETMTSVVNKAFSRIFTSVTKLQGALTKVIMFDKGLTYLVVFGLPGYITENQCAHALKFSHQVRRALLGLRFIDDVSIGVTTGSCYCGVLGHPRRQEYTVIGRKVNKAARLMCYYPGQVTCDQDTAYHSKLPTASFELQEYKELKGIANPGKIYEYVNLENTEDQTVPAFSYPLVGREAELKIFRETITRANKEFSDAMKMFAVVKGGKTQVKEGPQTWMIIFEGENGIGKSRMLASCIKEAEHMNMAVYSVAMSLIHAGQSLYGVSALTLEALGLSNLRTYQEREDALRKRITDAELAADLCLINDILETKFPMNPKYAALDVNAGHVYGQHVLSTLLTTYFRYQMVMFVVDDAHLLDSMSWEYLIHACKSPQIIGLAALRRNAAGSPKLPETVTSQLYHQKSIKIMRLNGLDPSNCLNLACQMMEVAGIPQDLEKVLIAKSQGVPAWCDQVLHELLRTGVLKYSTSSKSTMSYCDKKFLERANVSKRRGLSRSAAISNSDAAPVTTAAAENIDPSSRLLVVKSGTNLGHVQIHGTLHEILLDSYDELNSLEQLILKCASVCGKKFSRKMVRSILPSVEINSNKYDSGFCHLMEAGYLQCGSSPSSRLKNWAATANEQGATQQPACYCRTSYNDVDYREDTGDVSPSSAIMRRPKYWSCKFMEFVKENLVEVVYDLMTEDQRKNFHLLAAQYLDSTLVCCENCGGGVVPYTYGIVLKPGDLGVLDSEETIRVTAQLINRHSVGGGSSTSIDAGNRKASLTTKTEGMRKKLTQKGMKVAQIEYEILEQLRKMESCKKIQRCCKGNTEIEDSEKLLQEELQLLRDADDDAYVNLKESGSDKQQVNDKGDFRGVQGTGDQEKISKMSNQLDFRMCECAALQAKVSIEMVKHYREAQKYGKCLINLLDAAEAVVTMGNGTQGLVHLEDAQGLMLAFKKGDLPTPDKDDEQDAKYDEEEAEGTIEYLSGLAYFEIGVPSQAKNYFLSALDRVGLTMNTDDNKLSIEASILKARTVLFRSHLCRCLKPKRKAYNDIWERKIRILSYLHALYKQEKKLETSLLVALWQVIISEQYGDVMQDVLPAYSNMIDTLTVMSNHKEAQEYEKASLNVIRHNFGSNVQLEPIGLLSTAQLFHVISNSRVSRGFIWTSIEAAYLGLRIAQTIHDNSLAVRLLPSLVMGLVLSLRITEVVDALQKLWYISEEEDDFSGAALYYCFCMDLLLQTAYPMEHFPACEHFVVNSNWTVENNMFRDFEIQFCMEASLALWYARYTKWESSVKWYNEAESHKPKLSTFLSVSSELKMLECQLIYVNHYLESKRYQHFAKARNSAKILMRQLTKSTKVVPVLKPRFLHLLAYYYRIRSRDVESEKHLKQAENLAKKMDNHLELEWISHSRCVWNDQAIPTIKFFWLEHTETHILDYHTSGKIPWANIMYSLPVRSS